MSSPLRGPKSRSGDCPARAESYGTPGTLALGGGAVVDDDGSAQLGGVRLYRGDQRGVLPVVDQRDQVGVADHVAQLGFDVPVVDVHGPGAQLVRRDQRLDRLDRVARVQADVVVAARPRCWPGDARAGWCARQARGRSPADHRRPPPSGRERRRRHARTDRRCSVPWDETRTCYSLEAILGRLGDAQRCPRPASRKAASRTVRRSVAPAAARAAARADRAARARADRHDEPPAGTQRAERADDGTDAAGVGRGRCRSRTSGSRC